jgi:hypothetical protein
MSEIQVESFNSRSNDNVHPFGYLYFTDGLRIGYAPLTDGVDEWGLFIPDQPYLLRGEELTERHVKAARTWVETNFAVMA